MLNAIIDQIGGFIAGIIVTALYNYFFVRKRLKKIDEIEEKLLHGYSPENLCASFAFEKKKTNAK